MSFNLKSEFKMLIFRRKNMTELTAVFVKKAGVYVNYEQNFPP